LAVAERSNLGLRIATGLVLIAVALATVWAGGFAFAALVAAGSLAMSAEWSAMHRAPRGLRLAGLGLLGGVQLTMPLVTIGETLMLLAAGAAVIGAFAWRLGRGVGHGAGGTGEAWHLALTTAAGLLYCGVPAVALVWLRGRGLGLPACVFVLAVVWATDIAAFFAGRAIGGPRLAPAISPNKTWAGAIGGVIGAMLTGLVLAASYIDNFGFLATFASLSGVLAALAILGDLFESALKRRAGVKDSGALLPGHGGVLDRLDGLVPVAIAGAAVFAWTGWAG
jgi:phosphatidate cytidylyltransferase